MIGGQKLGRVARNLAPNPESRIATSWDKARWRLKQFDYAIRRETRQARLTISTWDHDPQLAIAIPNLRSGSMIEWSWHPKWTT